jgi:hypothetical protein
MRGLRIGLGFVAVAAMAGHAAANADPWMGVWRGTLGNAAIRACFPPQDRETNGSYYYLRHLRLIPLVTDSAQPVDGSARRWSVDREKQAPRWLLSVRTDGSLAGSWSQNGKTLPIHLSHVPTAAGDEADNPCGGMTFHGPRVTPVSVSRKPAPIDGVTYSVLTANVGAHFGANVSTFALRGDSAAIRRVNADLAKRLPQPPDKEPPDYLLCDMNTADTTGMGGGYSETTEPDVVSRSWLVARRVDDDNCGGAHPNMEISWRIWNLKTGEEVRPQDWLTPVAIAKKADGGPEIGPALREMLSVHWPREDCSEVPETENYWFIHPTREGLAFQPELAHVNFACTEDAVIPFKEIEPLLSAKGRAAIRSIEAEFRKLPRKAKAD